MLPGGLRELIARCRPVARRLREASRLRAELERVTSERDQFRTWVPPGHFYSPIPSLSDVRREEARIFDSVPEEIPGVDLNEAGQLRLLDRLTRFYPEQPFEAQPRSGLRYGFENPNYSYADAVFLYAMIRYLRPVHVIEIGSGHSSCVILDTNELFFGHRIACTFIEPYPSLLLSLLKAGDQERIEIVPARLQEVPLERFEALAAGDILFVDSTHVAKVDSDVNHIFFRILPRLASGVFVHFHDVFYPFEYPKEWIYEGRAWNEAYVLRAFLQNNSVFEIALFTTYLERAHPERVFGPMPLCRRNPGGSIWLRKR